MFEKEAEEYARQSCFTEMSNPSLSESIDISDDIKEAVMFGYNKAKEEMQEQGLALQSDMDKTIEQNIQLKKQIEKVKCCGNCVHYGRTFELCDYSMGDEDYDCRGRKWEIKEND